jgi:glycosyltransferase involved in cell wall biosynthesis
MKTLAYSALIRTYNSATTLPDTLRSMETQSITPSEYVFVDSGSSDNTVDIFPEGSKVHKYVGKDFNYAEALNQGICHVSTETVLIISSHTSLTNKGAIEFTLALLDSNSELAAAYFCEDKSEELTYELIDKNRFNGFNGLWNTCALIRVSFLRRRGFSTEVFAAEDQEWARWLFDSTNKKIARVSGAGLVNRNPRKSSIKKRLNEYVAVAYFSNRKLLGPANICRVAYTAVKFDSRLRMSDRVFYVLLFVRLIACHLAAPQYKSRYF